MARLRLATRAEHERIERTPHLGRLFADDYQIEEYRALSMRLYGFYAALEPLLFVDLPDFVKPFLAHREKRDLIVRDLAALGVDPSFAVRLPRCKQLPALRSFAERMGVFYVLEGSTLGGQLIRRRLLERFGAEVESALHFYGCYGERAGAEWRGFRELMEGCFDDADPVLAEQVIASAKATFATLTEWLSHPSIECNPS